MSGEYVSWLRKFLANVKGSLVTEENLYIVPHDFHKL